MGSNDPLARPDEQPVHAVAVTGFYMDIHEVTNAEFAKFVEATGYQTVAERTPIWSDIASRQPPGAPPPDPELLVPGSLVFRMTAKPVSIRGPEDFRQWWHWTPGASWRHPQGPGSSIEEIMDHPVVHVAWEDAVAWCEWAGKQLPTEAQWEYAARGGLHQQPYVWGGAPEPASGQPALANIWQGQFPYRNTNADGYVLTAPVGSYPANGFGLHDMAGNVWEWCEDWYARDAYQSSSGEPQRDPVGPAGPENNWERARVQRGGSFLCHEDYCSSYRPSARMPKSGDTGLSHSGFRGVMMESVWRERLAAGQPPAAEKPD
jgi:formylglycine-generating enzyme required for sulfatase activity